ncbi:hypothetical protein NEMBOFW57_003626 [Staphylotrichum longicolle]|uniref:Uncharacterized protein n=1 Tax=Staphylotrichum longicolle TaxID=669026 RepID=A0AAD4FAA1_9PEZI|nr:hypothetical protein NEMBOFW57_003626 [Staphylotrichum longicolle]
MQFSNFVTILALAMTAAAVPTVKDSGNVLAMRHLDGDDHTYVCCNPAGRNCGHHCPPPFRRYCCKTSDVHPEVPHKLDGLDCTLVL